MDDNVLRWIEKLQSLWIFFIFVYLSFKRDVKSHSLQLRIEMNLVTASGNSNPREQIEFLKIKNEKFGNVKELSSPWKSLTQSICLFDEPPILHIVLTRKVNENSEYTSAREVEKNAEIFLCTFFLAVSNLNASRKWRVYRVSCRSWLTLSNV